MNLGELRHLARLLPLASVSTIACHLVLGDYSIEPVPSARTCELGEIRCVGAERQLCLSDGWRVQEICEKAADCNLALDNCSPCEPGAYRCNDGVPQLCRQDHTWENKPACNPAWTCRVDNTSQNSAERGYSCAQACPRPLAYACNNGVLQRCSRDQDHWETVEVCADPALCDAHLAEAQAGAGQPVHCAAPECLPGQYSCEGGTPRSCSGGRWSATADPGAEASCAAPCTPGATRCSGVRPYRCDDTGAWQRSPSSNDCASPALCDAASGTCKEPACSTPGEFQCTPQGDDSPAQRLDRCRADQSELEPVDLCPFTAACDALNGRCLPTLCSPGADRCNGSQLEFCSGTAWQGADVQGAGSLCPTSCSPNETRCNDRFLEECGPDGTWQRVAACATSQRCNAVTRQCLDPVCDENSPYRCTGNVLEKCNEERDGYSPLASCAPGQCDATLGRCRKGP